MGLRDPLEGWLLGLGRHLTPAPRVPQRNTGELVYQAGVQSGLPKAKIQARPVGRCRELWGDGLLDLASRLLRSAEGHCRLLELPATLGSWSSPAPSRPFSPRGHRPRARGLALLLNAHACSKGPPDHPGTSLHAEARPSNHRETLPTLATVPPITGKLPHASDTCTGWGLGQESGAGLPELQDRWGP